MDTNEILNDKNREYFRILSLVILLKDEHEGLTALELKTILAQLCDTQIIQTSVERSLQGALQLGLVELTKGKLILTQEGINFAENCSHLIDM